MLPDIIIYLNYLGTIIFTITGCLVAAKKRSDILAFILLGLVTAVGGGTIRDLLLGRTPIFWIENSNFIIICIATAVMMFTGLQHIKKIKHYNFFLIWADAIGLATFTITGTHIALDASLPILPSILLGVMSATFGGVIRDMIAGEQTLVLRNDIYMTAGIIGAITYISLDYMQITNYSEIIGLITILIVRGLAITFNIKLPSHI